MGNQKSCCVHTDHPTRHKYVIDGHQINCTNGTFSAPNQNEVTGFSRLLRRVRRAGSQGAEDDDLGGGASNHLDGLRGASGVNGSGNVRFRDHSHRSSADHRSGASNQQGAGGNFSLRRSLSILQHISEREPEDVTGDPSNSPTARTIFISCSRLDLCRVSRSKSTGRMNEAIHSRYNGGSRVQNHNDCDNNSNNTNNCAPSGASTSSNHQNNHLENGGVGGIGVQPPRINGFLLSGRKSNSCSTIFISDSTPSQPNLKYMLKAVALALYFHLRNPQFGSSQRSTATNGNGNGGGGGPHQPAANGSGNGNAMSYGDIFDERLHPLWLEPANGGDPLPANVPANVNPDHHSSLFASSFAAPPRMPDFRTIYRFFRMLFHSAQLTAECAVVSLVYLERIITCAELQLTPSTWRRLSLGSVLLASKVWDDQAVWNVDFCSILKNVSVEEMNELERIVLELIQFNINVPSSVYTKYFFDLRTLAAEHGLQLPATPLSRERAARLEAVSWIRQDSVPNNGGGSQTGNQSNQPPPLDTNGGRSDATAVWAKLASVPAIAMSPGASHGGSPSSLHRSRSTDHLLAERYRSRQSIVIP